LLQRVAAREAGRDVTRAQRRFDTDRARSAERVDQGLITVPGQRREHPGCECFSERCLGHGQPPATTMQERARTVGTDGAAVVIEPHHDELRGRLALLVLLVVTRASHHLRAGHRPHDAPRNTLGNGVGVIKP